ncbi:hypothetical protein BDC45DRAFT_559042 [Circinella umbellata]|nr:hypothetical protein BDC45DRAFT_559042 [Circinella umbellata]
MYFVIIVKNMVQAYVSNCVGEGSAKIPMLIIDMSHHQIINQNYKEKYLPFPLSNQKKKDVGDTKERQVVQWIRVDHTGSGQFNEGCSNVPLFVQCFLFFNHLFPPSLQKWGVKPIQ